MKPWDVPVTDVLQVYDGDSVRVRVDLGYYADHRPKLRLVIVDTPERGEPGWDAARAFTEKWLRERHNTFARVLRATTYGKTTFDRWMADIYDETTGDSLSSALLREGYAEWKP